MWTYPASNLNVEAGGPLGLGTALSRAQLEGVYFADLAYEISGAKIPAGDTGLPEPSTFGLTGANGLRGWRPSRRASLTSRTGAKSGTR
jgi:hypothetical protein